MKRKLAASLLGLASTFAMSTASAGWIDWTSSTSGTMDIDGTSVGVTLSGTVLSVDHGDTYFNNVHTGGTSATGTYNGLTPSDLIWTNQISSYTLTFDQTVSDLNMAMVSVGQVGLDVTYEFENAFDVVSTGGNYWGNGSHSVSGNDFTGTEFNGILHFAGDFDSITFYVANAESSHGFNFGTDTLAEVPAPFTATLLGAGLLGMAATRRRKSEAAS